MLLKDPETEPEYEFEMVSRIAGRMGKSFPHQPIQSNCGGSIKVPDDINIGK